MTADKPTISNWLIPLVVAAAGAVSVAAWIATDPSLTLTERVPGTDRAADHLTSQPTTGLREAILTTSDGVPADIEGNWSSFRGPARDNVNSDDNEPFLLARWPAAGPKPLWAIEVGEGYAGAAVLAGRVYLLDYDRKNQADAIRCLSLADGKEIWRYSYPVRVKRNHGMSRTVPAVTKDHVVTLGPKGHVKCLDAKTGLLRWQLHLPKEFGTKIPPWYAGQCPLIDKVTHKDTDKVTDKDTDNDVDENLAIIAPAGTDVLMMAVDCATGKIKWKTPNDLGWDMTHSSIMPMEFAGKRMYLYSASKGIVGVSADDGRILWHSRDWRIRIANIASPVPVGKGRIFLSGGYNVGSMMLQLKAEGDEITAKPLFRLKASVFGSTEHTPIFYEGYIYGVRPNGELVCLDLHGKVIWTSGPNNRFGRGPFLISQGLIYVMNHDGLMSLARAAPSGYEQLAQAQVLHGSVAEGPMAMADGRLIVRDSTQMICLDVAER